MDARTLAAAFIASCVVLRIALMFAIVMRTNPTLGIGWTLTGWNLYVTAVTTLLTYALAIRLWKARSVWLTGVVGGTVAAIICLPSALSTETGRKQMGYSLSLAFFEWFIVALAAHAIMSLSDHAVRRRKVS